MAKIIVVGYGTIGKHICEVAENYEHDVVAVVNSKSLLAVSGREVLDLTRLPDPKSRAEVVAGFCSDNGIKYALLALPSGRDGGVESAYITTFLSRDIKVVTAGKSALANRFEDIRHGISKIGFDAALGGGTGIPTFKRYALRAREGHPFVLTMVCNGTLNFAQTKVLEGWTAESICDAAVNSRYTEKPQRGQKLDALALYRGEFDDVRRKIALALNTSMSDLAGQIVTQDDFPATEFSRHDLRKVMSENARYRYMVRICTNEDDLDYFENNRLGGRIERKIGRLNVAAGFINVMAGSALDKWLPLGAGNAMRLVQNGDVNIVVGEGAGTVPTVGAMLSNLNAFIEAE